MKKDAVTLHCGDCLDVLASLRPNSIDACVTDPPYHLTTPGHEPKKWEAVGNNHGGGASPYRRTSTGFMGKQWDGGDIAFRPEMWREVLRVLKPGGHILAFGGTRTYHRMACAIEDAGFEIRDCVQWIYGSGFPKSHDVSKGIDKAAGAEREKVRHTNPRNPKATGGGRDGMTGATRPWIEKAMARGYHELDSDIPATDAARQWEGWGTALKPACEPIVLARKPLSEKTVAANVLRWGCGALNIDGCRVAYESAADKETALAGDAFKRKDTSDKAAWARPWMDDPRRVAQLNAASKARAQNGRWPANLLHDGSEEVVRAFPESKASTGKFYRKATLGVESTVNIASRKDELAGIGYGDSGSAARFFYTAKASKKDRAGSKHPTVKPIKLIRYLIRLITPPKGVVLDPFAGTGTTGEAAVLEGARAVLIEREREYIRDIKRRIGKPRAQKPVSLRAAA